VVLYQPRLRGHVYIVIVSRAVTFIDNFSGHELAVQLVSGLQGLLYVRIV
jgi:hypothetical protein